MSEDSAASTEAFIPAYKGDWPAARAHHLDWWAGRGPAVSITARLGEPREPFVPPGPTDDLRRRWIDPAYRSQQALAALARTHFAADAVPIANTNVGAGDLAAMLGAGWHFAESTVWYEPNITDPQAHPPLAFDPANEAFDALYEMTRAICEAVADRAYVGVTDLIENLDIIAAMRDPQTIMMDMIERPGWVSQRIEQITDAWFEAYERFYQLVAKPDGSSCWAAFDLWGPGRVANVQCDAAAMISPAMFNQFVVPELTRQCAGLDHAMYHLDGTQAMCHLDALLSIEPLDAIEWTPQAGIEHGGHPRWYDLYRRIKAGGKSVQAIGVRYDEVIPLLDAVGPEGMYVIAGPAPDVDAAEALAERLQPYYPAR